jgi:hypothetical protein
MNINTIILTFLSVIILSSCTKVVQLDLKSSRPQYVIEGNISNAEEAGSVRITRSIDFNETGCPPVSNALVVISDDMSHTDTLQQATPGTYQTSLHGIPGHTYQLLVQVEGQTFSASATMPQQVTMDTLYTVRESPFGKEMITPYVTYWDPKSSTEYYNFIVSCNGRRSTRLYFANDLFDDGIKTTQALRDFDSTYKAGDQLTVEMQSISKEMHDYLYSVQQNLYQNTATPVNPVRMISGVEVVGYFSAHTSQKRILIIPGL